MSLNQAMLNKLLQLIAQIKEQAINIDNKNKQHKAHRVIENNAIFSIGLFNTESDKFIIYAEETEKRIANLSRLIKNKKSVLAAMALEKIEQQITALLTSLRANTTMHDDAQIHFNARNKAIEKNKYKKLAQSVIQSSQILYQKLSQHHEYERRLQAMLLERELQRDRSKLDNIDELSQQVLVLHQRLGRCRKAITLIEKEIELAEMR